MDSIDLNFVRKAYRTFSKSKKAQLSIDELNKILILYLGADNFTSNIHKLRCCNDELSGYLIIFKNNRIFFPLTSAFEFKRDFIPIWGGVLNEAEVSFPPYINFGSLGEFIVKIKECHNEHDKVIIGNKALSTFFPPSALATLAINLYPKFTALADTHLQIKESIESYSMGHYRSAITTLIPCIENAIRELGKRHGLNEPSNVGTAFLIKIINKSMLAHIQGFILRDFDWYPQQIASVSFFGKFEERIQMMMNFKSYIENHLYQVTQNYSGRSNLNRHSIVHGFTSNYHSRENYLRLINVLNSVCFMLTFSGEHVSLFFPNETLDSSKLSLLLSILERTGIERARFLDENSILR